MLHWIWHQWRSEPARAILAGIVYAAVLALSLLFDGVRFGVQDDLRSFPAALPADLVAIESGNTYLALSPSKLPQLSRIEAESVPGVADVQPIVLVPVIFNWNGRKTPAMLLAFDRSSGPRRLAAGRAPTDAPEVVLDRNLAHLHNVRVGNRVTVLDYDLTVVGLSSGTSSPFMPYLFITYDRLIDLVFESDVAVGTDEMSLVSVLLVRLRADADPARVRRNLEAALPEADLYTPAELGNADAAFGERLLGPILSLMSGIAWLIALLTMGLLRYADVQSHLRQFGIQKALGASPVWLAGTLALGGGLISLSSLPLAVLLAKLLSLLTADWNPLYSARVWQPEVLARGFAAALGASLAGSLAPLRRLLRLDAAMVFQR